MQFSEYEMTTMIQSVAKTQIVLSGRVAAATDHETAIHAVSTPVTDDEAAAAWEALSKMDRYRLIDALSQFVLPVLPGLPEVNVEPGQRAVYEAEQVIEAARESVASDVAMEKVQSEQADDLTIQRAHLATLALGFLPLKPVEHTLTDADDADFDGFPVVPDSPEGL